MPILVVDTCSARDKPGWIHQGKMPPLVASGVFHERRGAVGGACAALAAGWLLVGAATVADQLATAGAGPGGGDCPGATETSSGLRR